MSNDALPTVEKHSKKSKSKKTKAVAEDAPAAVEDTNEVENIADSGPSEDVSKKDKKKKRKHASQEDVDEPAEVDEENGEKKKKKKKRKHADAETEAEASAAADPDQMEVDTPQPTSTDGEKKKKKRKHDAEGATPTADPSTSESKKEKKKKRKREEELAAAASLPTPSTSTGPSKASSPKPTPQTSAPSASEAEAFLSKHSITISVPANTSSITPVLSFSQLAIPSELGKSFKGFKEPTPIQACTWPPALDGRDVVGIAETGSGKTLAFGIPALSRLITSAAPKSKGSSSITTLVVAPTRELAIQTHDTLSALGAPFGIGSVAVFGGVSKEPQVKLLRNINNDKGNKGVVTRIVVGTPGRIIDLVQEGVCDLSGVNYLVLDEADRMLDKGFENDIRRIISFTKQGSDRQTMMFSATWPESVRRLASTFQQDPVRVTVGSDDLTANSRVEQSVEVLDDRRMKDAKLLGHLRALSHKKVSTKGSDDARILIFILYKREASIIESLLSRNGYSVGAIHGDMSQSARIEALENFKNGTTGLLVATDVAARGLDIPNVGAVINYSFPLTIEDYIHRIGRTGRGGKTGKSITFFTGDEHERSIAGELARVLGDGGFECEELKKRFPMTIKKKQHSSYGAFFRDDIPMTERKKITF